MGRQKHKARRLKRGDAGRPAETPRDDDGQELSPAEVYQRTLVLAEHASGKKDLRNCLKGFQYAAERGHIRAGGVLGDMLIKGMGVRPDPVRGVALMRQAAEGGCPDFWIRLGECYRKGVGVPEDMEAFKAYLLKAADAGESAAWVILGDHWSMGDYVDVDFARARKCYEKGAAAGSPDACFHLGEMYDDGMGVDIDPAAARAWYEKAYEGGCEKAMLPLAVLLNAPENSPEDHERAYLLLCRVAEEGNSRAQYLAGACCLEGRGTAVDPERALHWYRRAAEQDDHPAMCELGRILLEGRQCAPDPEEGIRWLKKSGAPEADFLLARCLFEGCHMERDPEQAVHMLERAGAAGSDDALWLLGDICRLGAEPVPCNADKALAAYLRAAERSPGAVQAARDMPAVCAWLEERVRQGSSQAALLLGLLHGEGAGVPRDEDAGRAWLERSAALGCGEAQELLDAGWAASWPDRPESTFDNALWAIVLMYNGVTERKAEAGNPVAQSDMARLCLLGGAGVRKSRVRARAWLVRAAARGYEPARRALEAFDAGNETPDVLKCLGDTETDLDAVMSDA